MIHLDLQTIAALRAAGEYQRYRASLPWWGRAWESRFNLTPSSLVWRAARRLGTACLWVLLSPLARWAPIEHSAVRGMACARRVGLACARWQGVEGVYLATADNSDDAARFVALARTGDGDAGSSRRIAR